MKPGGDFVNSSLAQGLASQQAPGDQAEGGDKGAALEGLLGVAGTRRHEAAVAAEKPAQIALVAVHQREKAPAEESVDCPKKFHFKIAGWVGLGGRCVSKKYNCCIGC